jgi:hypothetical protein
MNASPSPLLRVLAPVALAVTAAAAAANWYLEPENAMRWAAALGFTAIMTLVAGAMSLGVRKAAREPGWSNPSFCKTVDTIRGGIVFGTFIMLAALGPNLATELGLGAAAYLDDLSERLPKVATGIFFMWFGNAMPKALTPLSAPQCHGYPVRAQAFQRFIGWTWVLTGLAFAIAWLALPIDLASPVASAIMITGMVLTATSTVRLWRAARPRPSQSGSA